MATIASSTANHTCHDIDHALAVIPGEIIGIDEYKQGRTNRVFKITLTDRPPLVLRVSSADHPERTTGYKYWHRELEKVRVPIPQLLNSYIDPTGIKPSFVILEHMEGVTLKEGYTNLSDQEKNAIGQQYSEIQEAISHIASISGFGGVESHNDPKNHHTWKKFIEAYIEYVEKRIKNPTVRRIGMQMVQALRKKQGDFDKEFLMQPPTAFHEDLTDTNLIMNNGKIIAILDFDEISFGDPLFACAHLSAKLVRHQNDQNMIDAILNRSLTNGHPPARFFYYQAIFACLEYIKAAQEENPSEAECDKLVQFFQDRIGIKLLYSSDLSWIHQLQDAERNH